jgi:hypothetical protein
MELPVAMALLSDPIVIKPYRSVPELKIVLDGLAGSVA